MKILEGVSRFVFGSECLGCGNPSESLDPWLCPSCREELSAIAKSFRFPREDVFSLYPMRPLTRRLIHALKYKSIPGMATYLVKHSCASRNGAIGQEFALFPKPLYFVPVPLHPARLRERGYNQAEKIAAALASVCGGRVCRLLRRRTFVVSQTKLSKEEREWNVAGAFERNVLEPIPTCGTIVIVDDVFTTGATTTSCLGALGLDLSLPAKVCTLLYDEPATAAADFAADIRAGWDYN